MGFEADPKGFFLIHIDGSKIVVEHYGNVYKGNMLATGKANIVLKGKRASDLYSAIAKNGLVSRQDHSDYLVSELERAQECLEKDTEYIQR